MPNTKPKPFHKLPKTCYNLGKISPNLVTLFEIDSNLAKTVLWNRPQMDVTKIDSEAYLEMTIFREKLYARVDLK